MNQYSLIADAGKVIKNRFLLTKIVIDRVKQLEKGRKPKVEVEENTPHMEIALKEIIEGKIELVGLENIDKFQE